ncbi:MAG: tRNA uridine-5-carboxymethylaminomethyl(34) synthesis GTPase MnmE [Desulfobacterales bacterium]|nr:tRNA uridine-5-carboxymethylaminomethyl(34) synthesis GTPase MnmE [Desulfobacterales bacterium]
MEIRTIAAIATPKGQGSIGIIRLSGPLSLSIALSVFKPKLTKKSGDTTGHFKSHHVYYGHIVDAASNTIVDEVLLFYMKHPKSYTREDVVEIHAHSNYVILHSILNLLLNQGAYLAEPGEFTKRAFLNGRIDLTQAEAVIDIIQSQSKIALHYAINQVQGQLRFEIEEIRKRMLDILIKLEAMVDFPEDVDSLEFDRFLLNQTIESTIQEPLKKFLKSYSQGRLIREGLHVVIVGAPNVGKSSLLNRLLEKPRAIVTPIAGTTRDLIEDMFLLDGMPVVITDTAGLHQTNDPIETIGIEKALDAIHQADIILWVIDASSCHNEQNDDDGHIFQYIHMKPSIVVINKIDLVSNPESINRLQWIPDNIPCVTISALKNTGIQELKKNMLSMFPMHRVDEHTVVPNLRHQKAIENAVTAIESFQINLEECLTDEILIIDIRAAITCMDEILGQHVPLDILDHIFSQFCIGK